MIVLFLKLQQLEMQPTVILIKFKIIAFVYLFIKENGIMFLRGWPPLSECWAWLYQTRISPESKYQGKERNIQG